MGQIIGEGITFDDVLLVPAYSQVVPNQVDLTTWLTKKIKLNIPVMAPGIMASMTPISTSSTNTAVRPISRYFRKINPIFDFAFTRHST